MLFISVAQTHIQRGNMAKAETKRALTNSQKAQILIDMLGELNTNAKIDSAVKKHEYRVHPEKLRLFKDEMSVLVSGGNQIKSALGVSFKSIAILGKEQAAIERSAERKRKQMSSMLSSLAGKARPTKQVVFEGTEKTRVVDFPK